MIRFTEPKPFDDGTRRPVMLYGRWWSADDADYAREIEADQGLRAPDLERLWRTNRPSVRGKAVASVDMSADTPMSTPDEMSTPATAFTVRLAELGLSVRAAAQFLNVSAKSVQRWKREGAPADVMAQLK